MAENSVIHLNPLDEVVIAVGALSPGEELTGFDVRAREPVPAGHKVAVRDLAEGAPVRRYGQIIGYAACPIASGEHVHVHNLVMGEHLRDYGFCEDVRAIDYIAQPATFDGIVRPDGRVATRNYIGILTSVNCSATVAKAVAARFDEGRLADYPGLDGVVALTHSIGCCIDAQGEGLRMLRRTLAGYARQANFLGVLIIGLGCETNQIASLMSSEGLVEGEFLRTMTIQESGGTSKTVASAASIVSEMAACAAATRREKVSASHLILGLECGGSDGYSGITANPALGAAADLLVRHGGTAVLSETPEIYGAEHLLTRRAVSPAVGQKLIDRIRWWEEHAACNKGELNNNPTAGNKAGGLTTILEKSLGAVAKGGSMNLEAVYEYAEAIQHKGFCFMDTPGFDPISVTGLVAGGANVICFTTGRGSAYGCAPSPSLKLGTNTALWLRQEEDIDLNCGEILDGTATVVSMGERIFQMVLDTASGKKTKSELNGYGHNEFVPWFVGAIM